MSNQAVSFAAGAIVWNPAAPFAVVADKSAALDSHVSPNTAEVFLNTRADKNWKQDVESYLELFLWSCQIISDTR